MDKKTIIAEIKRTAEANGGKALGRGRFEQESGINIYQIGRFWARYSDAVQEAGFPPNALTESYDQEYLLEKLISVARELGHFPSSGELRLKKSSDPSFPSSNTFDARLGNKSVKLQKALIYMGSQKEFSDVRPIFEELAKTVKAPEESIEQDKQQAYGFVYLVQGHPGEYKIGRTNLVDRRLSELGATASVEQQLIHEIKTDDPSGIEAYWHRRFHNKRMRGEWFKLSAADVKKFKSWKKIF